MSNKISSKNNKKINITKFEKIMPKKGWIFLSVVFFVVGLITFFSSTSDYIKLYITRTHEMVVGDLVSADLVYNAFNHTEDSDWYPKYEYKYTVDGIEYNDYDLIKSTGIFTHISNDNKKIKILYDKSNPKTSEIFYIDYVGIIFGFIFIIIATYICIRVKK